MVRNRPYGRVNSIAPIVFDGDRDCTSLTFNPNDFSRHGSMKPTRVGLREQLPEQYGRVAVDLDADIRIGSHGQRQHIGNRRVSERQSCR
jgi:hypothetical protein